MSEEEAAHEAWLRQAELRAERPYTLLYLSTHGQLLHLDARRAFIGGAWASVIVMCQAIIEATLRDLHLKDYDAKAKELFFGQEDLERLRTLRNQLVHTSPPGTPSDIWTVSNGDSAACHAALEVHARWAYEFMLEAVYSGRE